MTCESVTQSVSNLALSFGENDKKSMSRPFGVAILMAGVDETGDSVLLHMDPSGTYHKYGAKAIGAGSEGAQTTLEEQYHKSMTIEEGTKLCLNVLKQVMEEKISSTNIEVGTCKKVEEKASGKFKLLGKDTIDALLKDI